MSKQNAMPMSEKVASYLDKHEARVGGLLATWKRRASGGDHYYAKYTAKLRAKNLHDELEVIRALRRAWLSSGVA